MSLDKKLIEVLRMEGNSNFRRFLGRGRIAGFEKKSPSKNKPFFMIQSTLKKKMKHFSLKKKNIFLVRTPLK